MEEQHSIPPRRPGDEAVGSAFGRTLAAPTAGAIAAAPLAVPGISSQNARWTDDLGEDFADDICDGDTIAGSWVYAGVFVPDGDGSIAIAAGETRDDAISRREHENVD